MDNKKRIDFTKGDNTDTIQSLIDYLEKCKKLGATHYNMYWSKDPIWSFKWFETFKLIPEEEMKRMEIEKLQNKIDDLKK